MERSKNLKQKHNLKIRKATPKDLALILNFIKNLAKYERAAKQVTATELQLKNSIFKKNSGVYALICDFDNKPIGFAIYFFSYSTWLAKKGLYLEDLYIEPKYRSKGAGKALLKYIAKEAIKNDCPRLEWSVLDWNHKAIDFYKSVGAKPQSKWTVYRLTDEALKKFSHDDK